MKLSTKEIQHIAMLARLALTEEETEMFRGQMLSILEFVDILGKADTKNIAPMARSFEVHNVLREDVAEP